MSYRFKSNRSAVKKLNNTLVDMVLGNMSLDIEVALKTTSGMPVDKGQMKASTRHFRNKQGQFRVEIDKEYAAVQEAGVRLTGKGAPAVMERYTTAGTSHHFFLRAIEAVTRNRDNYFSEARKALGL